MKRTIHSLCLGLSVTAVAAGTAFGASVCVDTKWGYKARPVGPREVAVRNDGAHKQQLKLTTTCVDLFHDDSIAVDSFSRCVDKGDTVIASALNGRRQVCRVTAIAAYDGDEAWGER